MDNWKSNLAVIWVSQLLSIAGFFFAIPFGPYYIQELGIRDPVQIKFWLAKETPPEKHGAVFGWSATARSAGWFLAPLLSGLAASGFGIRSIYFFGALLFVGLGPLITWVAKKLAADRSDKLLNP